jgi:hypothetical protein
MICLQGASIKRGNLEHSAGIDGEGGSGEGFRVPYFLGGFPMPGAPPTARRRLVAPPAAVWWGALAAAASAASRRIS